MILYGTGDPIAAYEALAPHVISIHAKDGDWPPRAITDSLGTERPLGQGAVDIPKFIQAVKRSGYSGTINIEREIADQPRRMMDIANAVRLLETLCV